MNGRANFPATPRQFLAELRACAPGAEIIYGFGRAGPLAEVARDAEAAGFCRLHLRRPKADGVRHPLIEYIAVRTDREWDDAALPKKARAGR